MVKIRRCATVNCDTVLSLFDNGKFPNKHLRFIGIALQLLRQECWRESEFESQCRLRVDYILERPKRKEKDTYYQKNLLISHFWPKVMNPMEENPCLKLRSSTNSSPLDIYAWPLKSHDKSISWNCKKKDSTKLRKTKSLYQKIV